MTTQQPFAALIAARTVYVNSATGNDANPGTLGAPFQTLARAWDERQRYLVLRAQFTIQLLGVGPYTMPVMAMSDVDVKTGLFVLQGDPAARVVLAAGTATGDIAGFAIPTSAGVGTVDLRKHDYVRFTSGLCSGVSMLIVANTDTSISVGNKQGRVTAGAIANGDTWQIIRPGTVVNTPAAASGQLVGGFYNLRGGEISTTSPASNPGHWFYDLEFTGRVVATSSCLQFAQCRFSAGLLASDTYARFGMLANAFRLGVSTDTANNRLYGAGCALLGNTALSQTGNYWGVFSIGGSFFSSGAPGIGVNFAWAGGVVDIALFFGSMILFSDFGSIATNNRVVNATIRLDAGALARVTTTGWTFAVTSGSCWVIQKGARLYVENGSGMTGGTVGAGGYGVDVRGGGQAIYQALPTLTGATAGSDLRTTATAVAANAALAATPSSVDALGSPYGEVLARVA